MQLLLLLVAALAVTVALMPGLVRLAPHVGLVDYPGGRKAHSTPVPRVGGVALVIGTLTSLLLMAQQPTAWLFVYAGGLLLLAMGLWDDCVDLRWPLKLGAQVLAATLAVTAGDVRIDSITLVERIDLPIEIALPISVAFVVGATNAINLTDGLDGLAGGTTLLIVLVIGWLAYQSGNVEVATATAALAGSLLGFLRFNTHPARVFMGDSGSQFLGYMVAVVAVQSTQGSDTALSAALPLVLLAWPIADTANVMIERIRVGVSPFNADRRHLHHRLLGLGFDHYQSVIIVYVAHGALFMLAYALRFESDIVIAGAFVAFAAALLGAMHLARSHDWRWRRSEESTSAVARRLAWMRESHRLPRWTPIAIGLLLSAYPIASGFAREPISTDLRILLVGIVLTQLAFLCVPALWKLESLRRLPAYVMAAVLVYVDQQHLGAGARDSFATLLVIFGLTVTVVLQFRLSDRRRGQFTPLDALVLLVALLTPLLSARELVDMPGVALGVLKVVVLLYALEFLGQRPAIERWVAIAFVTVCALAIFG
jgi:UDP-GlcNAc:undecaprenyl-phosphate/decaprenyl-phosphate GlcNAc-1-phosphate transferase